MKQIKFGSTDNPDGLIQLVNNLPDKFTDSDYMVTFPTGYLYSNPFPILAAWSKRAPDGTRIKLDLENCQESTRRLIQMWVYMTLSKLIWRPLQKSTRELETFPYSQ